MFVLVITLCALILVLLQGLISDLSHVQNTDNRTSFQENLIFNSVMQSWDEVLPESTAWRAPTKNNTKRIEGTTSFGNISSIPIRNLIIGKSKNKLSNSEPYEMQSDDASLYSQPSLSAFADSLFSPPKREVKADWSVVLGTFSHYDNENWKEFLYKADVPMIHRTLLANTYETVTISREFEKAKKKRHEGKAEKKKIHHKKGSSDTDPNFEVLLHTSTWFMSHDTRFHLGEHFIETDPDGTDSKTLFFFTSPRHLVQNKFKDKWKLACVWHFGESGFNMTIIERERLLTARKFFHRLK